MSENRAQLADMAEALFAELAGAPFEEAWPKLQAAGFGLLLVPEAKGGFDGDWGDFAAVLRLAGYHALEAPLGEHVFASRLLVDAGLEFPTEPVSLALSEKATIPFGRYASAVLVAADDGVRLRKGSVVEGASLAGEPRDRFSWDRDEGAPVETPMTLLEALAFMRVCQTAGALDAALALAVEHCRQREQFGRTLAKFQAIQQCIAALACEAAAVNSAAQGAAAALDRHGEAGFEIAAAKLRTNRAIGEGCALAHQVHGAIGFTRDYPLNRLTRRMMGWRSEAGNDAFWAQRLGRGPWAKSGAALWDQLAARAG